ncbi:hypothetical protein [Streptomyces sp. NBC_00996]|uniref:hypothetical protein n=1 Tax=Streptomyces sp. NBC_00996 TaxID=2903710 RepID=UPI003870EB80|nr:hypothetical protein OG390_25475 [Streptomyces sp. NBC_00996]
MNEMPSDSVGDSAGDGHYAIAPRRVSFDWGSGAVAGGAVGGGGDRSDGDRVAMSPDAVGGQEA